jgi:ketosteroid isomerase-like protein
MGTMRAKTITVGLALFAFSIPAGAQQTDSVAVVSTINRFHDALAAGDSSAALELLTPDVIVLEAGGVETREEYRSHHLPGDIAFARAVQSERKLVKVTVRGDVAWVSATSTTKGTYRDRQIDSLGAELMVLLKTSGGWRISAIHWSSRRRT